MVKTKAGDGEATSRAGGEQDKGGDRWEERSGLRSSAARSKKACS
jgi:hypothetical protein